ncbi:phage protein Gp13 family protein [Zooshikella sp. RANM57]|uniref:phage protein Gp13 family protein n=1 Tax=Zooshikella sp. RANM57 TaxID=3425863 RepID=UPI003D6EB92A
MIITQKSKIEDCYKLAATLCEQDRRELEALKSDPLVSLKTALKSTVLCRSAFDKDGKIIAMFGINQDGRCVVPWLLSSTEIKKHKRQLYVWGRIFIRRYLKDYPHMTNIVHAENKQAIRFLKHLGAHFKAHFKYNKTHFVSFEFIRDK